MTCKSLVSHYHGCVKNKCVSKIKCNGVYQVHLMACRYSQVPGVDFSENFSTLVNNATFHVLLLMAILLK